MLLRRGKKPGARSRLLRERANMSFFIVIMFFAVFGVIVLTEILLIDERNGGGSGSGGRRSHGRTHSVGDRPDYDDPNGLQGEDYALYRVGFDEGLGVFMREGGVRGAAARGGGSSRAAAAGQSLLQPLIADAVMAIPDAAAAAAAGAAAALVVAGAPVGPDAPPGAVPPAVESRLPPLNASGMSPKDGTWQIVSGTRYKFFVFSAYYDRRETRSVRIIGATKTRGPDRVWCRLWFDGNTNPVTPTSSTAPSVNTSTARSTAHRGPRSVSVPAKVKVIRENWNLKYSAVFVLCALGRKLPAPTAVSVVARLRLPPANLLLVRNTDAELASRNLTSIPPPQPPLPPVVNAAAAAAVKAVGGVVAAGAAAAPDPLVAAAAAAAAKTVTRVTPAPDSIAVCVKPLHFNYNRALHLLEFLELHLLLGVQHFFLYNHTLGAQADCVLRDYVARGVVTLLPWQLNMISQKEIRTEGLFAALNDCLYRAMYAFAYTALVDLDEFILPRAHDTLPDLIAWLGTRMNARGTGAFSFQNAFFYLQWSDDIAFQAAQTDALEGGLVTLRKTRRRAKLHPHKQRSKYICRPERVVEAGNHFVWEFVPGHGTLNVPPDAAILHHYRVCEFGGDDCIKTASVVDKTAYRYRDRLTASVRRRYRSLQTRCSLPQLLSDPVTDAKPPSPPQPPPSPAAQATPAAPGGS